MDLNEVFFFLFKWKKMMQIIYTKKLMCIFSFFINWLLSKDCRGLQCRQSRILAGGGWVTQKNHSEWERTKSTHPMAVDWWTEGSGHEGGVEVSVGSSYWWSPGTHLTRRLPHLWWWKKVHVSFLRITIPTPCSAHSDDVSDGDERQYIMLWCDVISLLVIFLNVCQKDMKS